MPIIAAKHRTIAALICLAVFVLQPTRAQNSKPSCNCAGLHAGLMAQLANKNVGLVEPSVVIFFLLLNDSASDVDTAEGSWRIVINGKELEDSNFIFGNGVRPSGGFGRISSGANFNFTYALPIAKYFRELGEYKIRWTGKDFQSPVTTVTIPDVRAAQAHESDSREYRLDDSLGKIALYSGKGYRSYVREDEMVSSLDELERRVGLLPKGSRLYWKPFNRGSSGQPILFSEGQSAAFERFCRFHEIDLIVDNSLAEQTR